MQSRRRCHRQIRRFHFDAHMWLVRFPNAGTDAFVFPFHRVAIAGDRDFPKSTASKLDRPMGAHVHRHGPIATPPIRNGQTKAGTNDEN